MTPYKINFRLAAALCGSMASTSPALAEATLCNAQGACVGVASCEIVGDSACATGRSGGYACHIGGACGIIALPDTQSEKKSNIVVQSEEPNAAQGVGKANVDTKIKK
ncbi:hypothetical protein GGR95_003208 [Sulfitobacter undariae]|uniref:Uncharacterized protein n=1 Tax=Sulfitobacter undariae TaxID=1563671 RepID=A0A7W6H129_9RHOB|nr:hypothetical protein [Sulfitobacter undariae]MBB3995551.1 hypothetical protein [Sulfitobacter undariae]